MSCTTYTDEGNLTRQETQITHAVQSSLQIGPGRQLCRPILLSQRQVLPARSQTGNSLLLVQALLHSVQLHPDPRPIPLAI